MKLFFPRLDGSDPQYRQMLVFSGISLAGHLLLIGILILMPLIGISAPRINSASAIQVDLVAFNPEIPLPPAPPARKDAAVKAREVLKPAARKELVPIKEAYQRKEKMPEVAVKKPEPKIKTSMKSKSFNAQKAIEEAVNRIEAQVEKSQPKSISDRIAELRKEVGSQRPPSVAAKSPSGAAADRRARDFSQIEIYQAEVSVKLKNNWVFSEKLAGDTKGLESRLVIKILPDGSITDVWFEKRSGNAYLDDSAYKTVMKSNPLPPLPDGYPYYHLVLGFTPSGIHR